MSFLQIRTGAAVEPTGEVVVTIGFPAEALAVADVAAIATATGDATHEAVVQLITLQRSLQALKES